MIEEQQPGTYLLTFGALGLTPLDLASSMGSSQLWTALPIPSIPPPRLVHDGEIISIDVFIDPQTNEKLIDDIHVIPPHRNAPVPPRSAPQPPTVSGPAREFSTSDAEMQLSQPRVTLNANPLKTVVLRSVSGPLIWLYLPGHGRYILSLTARAGLDFKKAGVSRGGVLTFTLDNDFVELECNRAIAPGDAPYFLYILHDKDWEPTSNAQKSRAMSGTVGEAELTALMK